MVYYNVHQVTPVNSLVIEQTNVYTHIRQFTTSVVLIGMYGITVIFYFMYCLVLLVGWLVRYW